MTLRAVGVILVVPARLGGSILGVIRVGTKEQVVVAVRLAARRIVAVVEDLHPGRDGAMRQRPGKDVGADDLAVAVANQAIATPDGPTRSLELKASGRTEHQPRLKPLLGRPVPDH